MPRPTATRLDLASLERAARADNLCHLAHLLDRPRRTVQRWAAEGVGYWTADRLAASLDLHPVEVWPEWYSTEPYAVTA